MGERPTDYILELYVADHEAVTSHIGDALVDALDKVVPGRYRLSTVNVLESPDRAEMAKVFATPMLIRSAPGPTLRVLGDLSDTGRVLSLLDIHAQDTGP